MEGEQFSLCWNNFHSNLSTGFHSLLKDEALVDVTLAAGGRMLKAHKTILSICSPFFNELFRSTPSKHPIVILPDVNYNALCNVLQFMYRGEVSVSQEEIPIFMRVAEMLKVKGLTDNTASSSATDSNGFVGGIAVKSPFSLAEPPKQIMKRPRPVKKLIKPMQPLRPLEAPSKPKSPPPKRLHLEEEQEYPEALVKPKAEPKEQRIDKNSVMERIEDGTLDLSNILDTTLGEKAEEASKGQDTSTPGGGLMLMKSGRGQLVLIHNGHIYTHCDKQQNRQLWICVKKKTLNCDGCLTTIDGPILLSYSGHNHGPLQDVIHRLQAPHCAISPELHL